MTESGNKWAGEGRSQVTGTGGKVWWHLLDRWLNTNVYHLDLQLYVLWSVMSRWDCKAFGFSELQWRGNVDRETINRSHLNQSEKEKMILCNPSTADTLTCHRRKGTGVNDTGVKDEHVFWVLVLFMLTHRHDLLGQLNRTEPSLKLLITPLLFILWLTFIVTAYVCEKTDFFTHTGVIIRSKDNF